MSEETFFGRWDCQVGEYVYLCLNVNSMVQENMGGGRDLEQCKIDGALGVIVNQALQKGLDK